MSTKNKNLASLNGNILIKNVEQDNCFNFHNNNIKLPKNNINKNLLKSWKLKININ